jgi:hypothetical protein
VNLSAQEANEIFPERIWAPLMNLSAQEATENPPKSDPIGHAFLPLACRLHYFSDIEAISCLQRNRPFFAGDSRFRWLSQFLHDNYDTRGRNRTSNLVYLKLLIRVGLTTFYPDMAETMFKSVFPVTRYMEEISEAYRSGRTVLVHSLLHDVASLRIRPHRDLNASAEEFRYFFGTAACPVACKGELVPNTSCTRGCSEKIGPVRRYLSKLTHLLSHFPARTKPEALGLVKGPYEGRMPPKTPIWVSIGKRPPRAHMSQFDWQDHATLSAIQDAAADLVRSSGWQMIDLRELEIGTDRDWWMDDVHWQFWVGTNETDGTDRIHRFGILPWLARILFDAIC